MCKTVFKKNEKNFLKVKKQIKVNSASRSEKIEIERKREQ